jgi:hypothetical protein
MSKRTKVKWKKIAEKLGVLRVGGETGGSDYSRLALEEILGIDFIKNTVDYALSYKRGSLLAEGVLSIIGSPMAMDYCYQLYKSTDDTQTRNEILMMLKKIGDRTIIKWLPEFLSTEECQSCALDIIDQFIFIRYIDIDELDQSIKDVVKSLLESSDSHLRAKAEWILSYPNDIENECGIRTSCVEEH